MRVQLRESQQVTLVGGNGTAKVGPLSAREIWYPSTVHVSANIGSVVNEASCNVYVGNDTVNPNNFRDGTFSGSSGDSTDRVDSDVIHCGWYVFAVWTGGDAGAIATITVTGEKEV